jgi:hypothetical protein
MSEPASNKILNGGPSPPIGQRGSVENYALIVFMNLRRDDEAPVGEKNDFGIEFMKCFDA